MFKTQYDYVIIGAGIAGCSVAYFLKEENASVLLIDKNSQIANAASGAAGAFLSPLLGKPNSFKNLVSNSLKFSIEFYKSLSSQYIDNCGVCRIPKDNEDKKRFVSYKPYIDFSFEVMNDGYFFDIGSRVEPKKICEILTEECDVKLDYDVEKLIQSEDETWLINDKIKAKNIILTTGANTKLIEEEYFNIRAVWGQKIDISTTTCTTINYHKECSLSAASKTSDDKIFNLSIGATHHRFKCDKESCNFYYNDKELYKSCGKCYTNDIIENDTKKLLALANDIVKLNDIKVLDTKIGARACSLDYFPIVGNLVDSKTTIQNYPHLINGSFVTEDKLTKIKNLFVLNGVGGRGFVLSPYLAKQLVDFIKNNKKLDEDIIPDRLFKRWVKKVKLTNS